MKNLLSNFAKVNVNKIFFWIVIIFMITWLLSLESDTIEIFHYDYSVWPYSLLILVGLLTLDKKVKAIYTYLIGFCIAITPMNYVIYMILCWRERTFMSTLRFLTDKHYDPDFLFSFGYIGLFVFCIGIPLLIIILKLKAVEDQK